MNDDRLLTLTLQLTRAIHLARDAEEESAAADQGHGLPSTAQSRCKESAEALRRSALEIQGEAFRFERRAIEWAKVPDSLGAA